MKRIAVFASGQGTNTAALIRHFSSSDLAQVTWVVSNRRNAPVLELAGSLKVEASYVEPEAWENEDLLESLRQRQIDLVVLAGFLKLVPVPVIREYKDRIINIHPALLPKFGGKGMYGSHVHKAVVESGDPETGITIHHVNEHFDKGEIISQFKTPVLQTDSAEDVERKVRELEQKHFAVEVENIIKGLM